MNIIDDKIAELERQIELLKSLKTTPGTIDPLEPYRRLDKDGLPWVPTYPGFGIIKYE